MILPNQHASSPSSSSSSSSSYSTSSSVSLSSDYIYSLPTDAGNDSTLKHLNEILPPIKLLDPSSVSDLTTPVQLGYGSFGSVDLMTSKLDSGYDHLVAVKTAFLKSYTDPDEAWNQMILESRVMEFLTSVGRIPYVYGVIREGDVCRMVQEFIGNKLTLSSTTFLDVLLKGRPTLTALECMLMTSGIANALHAMHLRGLLHNDVAARNILIYYSADHFRFRAKLTDFGMVSSLKEPRSGNKMTFASDAERDQYLNANPEVAPEKILHGAPDSVQCDTYSLGYGIKVLGMGTGSNEMFELGEACTRLNADDRPTLDHVITTLDTIARNEEANPVYRPIDRPLF